MLPFWQPFLFSLNAFYFYTVPLFKSKCWFSLVFLVVGFFCGWLVFSPPLRSLAFTAPVRIADLNSLVTGTEQLSSDFTAGPVHCSGLSWIVFSLGGGCVCVCPVHLLHETSCLYIKKRNSKHDIYPIWKTEASCQANVPVLIWYLTISLLMLLVPSFFHAYRISILIQSQLAVSPPPGLPLRLLTSLQRQV